MVSVGGKEPGGSGDKQRGGEGGGQGVETIERVGGGGGECRKLGGGYGHGTELEGGALTAANVDRSTAGHDMGGLLLVRQHVPGLACSLPDAVLRHTTGKRETQAENGAMDGLAFREFSGQTCG